MKKRVNNKYPTLNLQTPNIDMTNPNLYNQAALSKFNPKNLIKNFVIHSDLALLKHYFKNKQIEKLEFIEILLKSFTVNSNELLHAVWGLARLHENICIDFNRQNGVYFTDLLSYMIKEYDGINNYNNKIKEFIDKEIDSEALMDQIRVYEKQQQLMYININIDDFFTNGKSFNSIVKNCLYEPSINRFIINIEGSNKVYFFNEYCEFLFYVIPEKIKDNENVPIQSVAFSSVDKRVS